MGQKDTTVPVIEARGLVKTFKKGVTALDGVDLKVDEGQVLVLIGPSGSGKSTLIRCLNGLERVGAGQIFVEGERLELASEHAWRRVRLSIGMVFQDYSLFPHLSAMDNICLAPVRAGKMRTDEAKEHALKLLDRVGLRDKADARPIELSGGQQQRVAIVRALAMRPKAILFDEPTSALDPEMIGEVLQVMRELAMEGTTMVVVTHEMGFAREVADVAVFMDKGRVVETAAPDDLFSRPENERTQAFLEKII